MPIHEIREELTIDSFVRDGVDPTWALFVKKIPLQFGKRHTLVHLDFFDDGLLIPSETNPLCYEFFLSVYPVHPTDMVLSNGTWTARGPAAADDNVLFKRVVSNNATNPNYKGPFEEQFPNQFLGATPTFSFYTDHVYMNLIVHFDQDIPDSRLIDVCLSMYMAVEQTTVDDVEWSIGAIREYDDAQYKQLVTTGVVQNLSTDTLNPTGRWLSFPSWSWGGIRPERMLDTQGVTGASLASSFINLGPNQAEPMMDDDNMQIFFDKSRTMVTAGEAFGGDDPGAKGAIPDWLNFSAMTSVYGLQRPDFPALKYTDTGLTLML